MYIGGTFAGTAVLGRCTLARAGDADGYVARYRPSGDAKWATVLGGVNCDVVSSLAVDPKTRKVFVTGMMHYTPQATNQSFMVVLGPNGQRQRTELVDRAGTSSCGQLAIDNQANVYSFGVFTGSCHSGPIAHGTTATQSYFGRFGRSLPRPINADDNRTNALMASEIRVFPVPAQQQLAVRLAGPSQAQHAALYNSQGHLVAERTIAPANALVEVAFDTAALPDSLYVLRLVSPQAPTTRLVTVQHQAHEGPGAFRTADLAWLRLISAAGAP